MPRSKLIPLTMEQIEADGWKRTNKAIKTAMVDAEIDTVEELANQTGIPAPNLYKRFSLRARWTMNELFRVVYVLKMDDASILKMMRGGRGL